MVMERRTTTTALLALAAPRGPRGPRWHAGLLARYLALVLLLLGVVFAVAPRPPEEPGTPAWDYQRERVQVDGGGALNVLARNAMRATAWTSRAAVERQRDVHRLNLLQVLVGDPAAAGLGDWRQRHRLALEGGTLLAILALVAYGVLRSPPNRTWLLLILLLVGMTVLVTKSSTAVRLAGAPGRAVGEVTVRGFAVADPANEPGRLPTLERAQRELLGQYWTSFVADPLSRMQTGTTVLTQAPPADKPGILESLRRRIAAVDGWAVGRRGWERAFIATTALLYALPFAVVLGALAMLATCAQALVLLLAIGGLAVLPLTVDPRLRRPVARYWLAPLGGALLVYAAASLLSLVLLRAATLLHGADEHVGALLAGSAVPVAVVVLVVRRLRRSTGDSDSGRDGSAPRRLALVGGGSR
ncbi:MAG TPA: hypothetical protein VKG45_07290 [Actinomycetes bacterium]|nr:hypothetical protein [Actinomycetes bacterium]